MKRILFSLLFFSFALLGYSQVTVKGTLVDASTNEPLIGASILKKGTAEGTITDIDGSFMLQLSENGGVLEISYVGYETADYVLDGSTSNYNLGNFGVRTAALGLEEVVITGVVDIVKDRETPVAVSTISASDIQLKLGTQEFPEIMKTTPSVYATKTGGGYGDGRINVRGFNQRNMAVIINGQPVNDMENGWVYWSNWAGLQDVASGVEIQRGLGASKLAVPSVGGTINVVTNAADTDQGGFYKLGIGNDGYVKNTVGYNTGLGEKGWAFSLLLGHWKGNGWVDGTKGAGFNYLGSIAYKPSDKQTISLTYTGAGQWHHQRSAWLSIRDYENYGGDDFRKFNADWGMLDGEEYTFRRNFYNKPIATLNWDINFNDNLSLATAAYGSWGRGGGTGPRGRNFGIYPFRKDLTQAIADGNLGFRTAEGLIDFPAVVAQNQSGDGYDGPLNRFFEGKLIGSNSFRDNGVNRTVAIRRASINSHDWYGVISNLKYNKDRWTLAAGVDARTYSGFHYRVVNDLLGLDGYYSTGNRYSVGKIVTSTSEAKPFSDISTSDKINYYNIGEVSWLGFNGLAEYNTGVINAVLQAGVSTQGYKRIDYFAQFPHVSDEYSKTGGFLKGGLNYNVNSQHNVFFNAGIIYKQPLFDAVFPNFGNTINQDVENEKIVSFELGYGLRTRAIRANVNFYTTDWSNRWISRGIRLDGGTEGTAVFSDLANIHSGIEIDAKWYATNKLSVTGMATLGNWKYGGDTQASVFDDNQTQIGTSTLYLDGVKVGDAAQTIFNLGADYDISDALSVDATWMYYDNLYARFNADDSAFLSQENQGAVKLPSYNLMDFGMTYRVDLPNNQFLSLRLNLNNVFDTEYISDSNTNIHAEAGEETYKGVSKANYVWWGFGRTWNVSAKYSF